VRVNEKERARLSDKAAVGCHLRSIKKVKTSPTARYQRRGLLFRFLFSYIDFCRQRRRTMV
jgi:hypothetical protein